MKDYGKTRSIIRPEEMVIDEFNVWIHSNIVEVSEEDFTGYEFNMVQYDKDEFIKLQAESNKTLQNEITNTQLALCELYEGLVK